MVSGGQGDADLYVRYNAPLEKFTYNRRPLRSGNNEICTYNTMRSAQF